MNRQRTRHQKSDNLSKLDEFPDDFDDVYFHNQAVEQDKKIPIVRNIVYKKIKNAIIDRVSEYKEDDFPLNDKFTIDFELTNYSEFQWAVIREELVNCGFDARFEFDDNKKPVNLQVFVERTIDVNETLEEKLKHECDHHHHKSDEEEEEEEFEVRSNAKSS